MSYAIVSAGLLVDLPSVIDMMTVNVKLQEDCLSGRLHDASMTQLCTIYVAAVVLPLCTSPVVSSDS